MLKYMWCIHRSRSSICKQKKLGVVVFLDKDEAACCNQDVVTCLNESVVVCLDKNNN